MLSDEYIAGFMDGEGTFGIYMNRIRYNKKTGEIKTYLSKTCKVAVSNTYLPILEEIRAKYGGRISLQVKEGVRGTTKDGYRLSFRYGEMLLLLPAIIPYLVEKKIGPLLYLNFCSLP